MEKVLIVGSGRSGRGMLGELYEKDGFMPVFADIDVNLLDGLKKQGYYEVSMHNIKENKTKISRIEHFETVDVVNEYDRYIELMAKCRFVSSALMPDAFEHFAKAICDCVIYRRNKKIHTPIYITLGANYVGLRQTYQELIEKHLGEKSDLKKENVHLLMSIVNRKNLLPAHPEEYEDRYRIEGDDKPVLRVDDDEDLRKEEGVPSFFRFEEKLDAAMAVKIWTGNVVQCSMAFVALQKGYTNTNEAANDPQAASYAYYASKEAYDAVAKEYGLSERSDEDTKYTVTIFQSEDFKDSLYRIAREPIRKFKRNDRFIGPALCALKHGILPYYISRCLAYGFLYFNDNEKDTLKIRDFIKENGIEKAVENYCELDLSRQNEKLLFDLIIAHYRDITKEEPLKEGFNE